MLSPRTVSKLLGFDPQSHKGYELEVPALNLKDETYQAVHLNFDIKEDYSSHNVLVLVTDYAVNGEHYGQRVWAFPELDSENELRESIPNYSIKIKYDTSKAFGFSSLDNLIEEINWQYPSDRLLNFFYPLTVTNDGSTDFATVSATYDRHDM